MYNYLQSLVVIRMKIGIDIDGVIAQNLDIAQLRQGNDEEIYRNLTLDENFLPVLEILRRQNYQIYFITARGQEFKRVTKEWLRKNKVSYDKIFFNPSADWHTSPYYKSRVIKQEGINILIDDLSENISWVNQQTNCWGILFSNWNEISNVILPLLPEGGKEAIGR